MPELNLDELERLAKAALELGNWERLKGHHENTQIWQKSAGKSRWVAEGRDDACTAYIVAACNSTPGLIAENRALQKRVEDYSAELTALYGFKYDLERRVQELERQRDILAHRLADAAKIHVKAYSAEMWIELAEIAAKEAGE